MGVPFVGIPRSISAGGIEMDLPGLKNYNAKLNGDRSQLISFRFQMGLLSSALEHGIPEQMFATPENPGEAVSAVKALAKAAQEGQRIYHVTQANVATVMPNIHIDGSTEIEIGVGVAAGKVITVHTDPISVHGWSGTGYVVFDPISGDGAYRISGGTNGSFWDGFSESYDGDLVAGLLMIIGVLGALASAPITGSIMAIVAAVSIFHAIISLMKTDLALLEGGCPDGMRWMNAAFTVGFTFLPFRFADYVGAQFISAFWGWASSNAIVSSSALCRGYR